MADDLGVRYADLLSGSFDCAGRIVLNAFLPFGCSPGGFRAWWRALHDGSDEHLDDTRLMRMAGRFGRRVRWGRVGRSAGHLLQARQAHWLIAGLTVGIISATRARSLFDRFSTVAVLIGLSMPVFVIGELLILVVFLPLNEHSFHWIQTGHCGPSQGLGAWFGHMILPWITLAAVQAAVYTRLSRGQLLDTLGEDYIRTTRAKGLSERQVIFRQASGEAPVATARRSPSPPRPAVARPSWRRPRSSGSSSGMRTPGRSRGDLPLDHRPARAERADPAQGSRATNLSPVGPARS